MSTDIPGDGLAAIGDVVASLPQLIVVVDEQLAVRFMNRAQGGYRPEQVVGRSILDFMDPEYRDQVRDLIQRVFRTGQPATYEIPAIDASGERQWHEGVIMPVARKGLVRSAVISTTNVTARRRAQQEADRLRSLVPLCAWCRRVRTDEGYWATVEAYIEQSGRAKVTHALCSSCEAQMEEEGGGGGGGRAAESA